MDQPAIRQVRFTCPCCKHETTIEEYTSCDGIESEVVGLNEEGDIQYGNKIGVGDTYDVEYRCTDCGQPLDCKCREELLHLECVVLGDPIKPAIKATLIIYVSRPDANGNRYTAFTYVDHVTGSCVQAKTSGGESNIRSVRRLLGDTDSINISTIPLTHRDFRKMTKDWSYAGCTGEELAQFIKKW